MLNKILRNLGNGKTHKLGNGTWAEKSGNGEVVRFVRQNGNTQVVFHTVKTNEL